MTSTGSLTPTWNRCSLFAACSHYLLDSRAVDIDVRRFGERATRHWPPRRLAGGGR